VLDLIDFVLKAFGYEYTAYLATKPDEKYIGSDEIWAGATAALREAAERVSMPLELDEGGGAFYGPKIDFKQKDALGREWQNSTVQCDFNLPERFELVYTDKDGVLKRPIMVHRAILGSLERFVGGLIEHYAGAFPLWLAPVQVVVLPIADRHLEYAERTAEALEEGGLRAEVDRRSQKIGAKIRDAQLQKVPFMLVVGDREAESGEVSVRHRSAGDLGSQPLPEFIAQARRDIDDHAVQEWPLRQGSAAPA
jgi:threonyl-tRNA synthetase